MWDRQWFWSCEASGELHGRIFQRSCSEWKRMRVKWVSALRRMYGAWRWSMHPKNDSPWVIRRAQALSHSLKDKSCTFHRVPCTGDMTNRGGDRERGSENVSTCRTLARSNIWVSWCQGGWIEKRRCSWEVSLQTYRSMTWSLLPRALPVCCLLAPIVPPFDPVLLVRGSGNPLYINELPFPSSGTW